MRRALLALLLVAPLSACGPSSQSARTVVAAAYPFQWLASRIGGPGIRVVGLVKPGAEPHDVELTPRQVGELQEAKVVLYLKGFQPAVDDAVKGLKNAYDLGAVLRDRRHDGSALDPHVWLDPVLMRQLAAEVTSILERTVTPTKPDSASGVVPRGAEVDSELAALDALFQQDLRGCTSRVIVTSHAAFGYLAARYGLQQLGITGLSPDAEPSPGRLAEVAAYARAHHVGTIFFEALVSPKVAQTVAAEVGARTAVLDPLEGVRGHDDYLSVQRRNAAALHQALGCA